MSNFLLLAICLIAGLLLRYAGRLPANAPSVFNGFILYISLPGLILAQMQQVTFDKSAVFPVLMPWILFVMSSIVFLFLGKIFKWDRKTIGTLVLMNGLGNTSFVGIPMLEAIYGQEAIKTGVLLDQLGSFPVFYTFGLFVASISSARDFAWEAVARKVLSFPPVYALIIALLMKPLPFPHFLTEMFSRLGATLTPLALVSVGFQLNLNRKIFSSTFGLLATGLVFKLIFGPALMLLIYVKLFRLSGFPVQITLVECAMAPMISAAIVAAEYRLNTELANLLVGVGIPLSFLTVPLWAFLLRNI
jgi:malate permease and related proteins